MPNYKFFGRTAQGQPISGNIDASSASVVADQLVSRDITPVTISEVNLVVSAGQQINSLLGGKKVKPDELIMFCRQMHTITKSGVPLVKGLRGLSASLRNEYLRSVFNDLAEKLESGASLSAALSKHGNVFDQLFINMINVGESSGQLDQVFKQLAFYLERDEQSKKSLIAAVRYPLFVMFALVIATIIVNILVIPKFAILFEKYDAGLPWMTSLLLGMSYFFVHYWWLFLGFLMAVGGCLYAFVKNAEGDFLWSYYKLKMPLLGGIISRALMARYARGFSLMLKAGVPINQALLLCARATNNTYLSRKINRIRSGVERGDSLIKTHVAAHLFSPLVLQMISVGEESGQVVPLLEEVADFYEREVDYDLKTLSAKIEPILVVIMAVFVTILALGIFLPMWDMYTVQQG